MKIVISPAKSLDFESPMPTGRHTQPLFLDQAEKQLNYALPLAKGDYLTTAKINQRLKDISLMREQMENL